MNLKTQRMRTLISFNILQPRKHAFVYYLLFVLLQVSCTKTETETDQTEDAPAATPTELKLLPV